MTASIIGAALFLPGFVFLFAAALGVLRFSDPLQRMHAATKAGTLGAAFCVCGAMVSLGEWDAVFVGVATLLFLLLTIPIAGHLLGRAAYVSGTRLDLEDDRDALKCVLARAPAELDERLMREETDPQP